MFIQLPDKAESINIRILAPPERIKDQNKDIYVCRCQVLGIKQHYLLKLDSTIYKGMSTELKKANIHIDDDLKCLVNCVFTIAGREWFRAPKELWKPDEKGELVPPKTFAIALRKDIMNRDYENNL
jgi:hypothetical protein